MSEAPPPRGHAYFSQRDRPPRATASPQPPRSHTVAVVGRSEKKTTALAQELGADHFVADFARLTDVRSLADALQSAYPRIDVLVNNAGGIFGGQTRTVDGFEKTLQVNHLAPFLLTNLLVDSLTAGRASIVNTASVAARLFGNINLADLDNATKYSANKAYGDAKLANILFAKELDRRFGDRGISAAAFHPGVVRTSFASDTTSQYYEKNKVAATNPQAADAQLAADLWVRSAEMVGLSGAGR